jgi:tetratricopeptide (TPR) repeat protein
MFKHHFTQLAFHTMKQFLSLILLFLPVLLSAQADEAITASAAKREEGNLSEAMKILNKAIGKYPEEPDLYHERAMTYLDAKKYDLALLDFSQAISLDSTNSVYWANRANLLSGAGYYNEALYDYYAALERVESDTARSFIYINRAGTYLLIREFEMAYDDLMEAYRIDSLNTATLNNLGTVLDDLGRTEESIIYLKKVIELDPGFLGGYANLAFQFGKLGRHQEALDYSNKAIAIAPDQGILYNNRGFIYYSMGEYKKALKDINKSLKMYPMNSYAYRNRALVYIAQKKNSSACEDLKKAIELGFTTNYGPECEELLRTHCN